MTREEFARVVKTMAEIWSAFPVPRDALARYWTELKDLEAAHAYAALETLAVSGRERPPTAPFLRRKVMELQLDAPEWSEVWRLANKLLTDGYGGPYHNFDGARWPERLAAATPVLREFFERLGSEQVAANVNEQGGEARLREKWKGYVNDRAESAALAALPVGRDLPRIARAARELKPMSEVFKELPQPDEGES